jgi:hypothetical protein
MTTPRAHRMRPVGGDLGLAYPTLPTHADRGL